MTLLAQLRAARAAYEIAGKETDREESPIIDTYGTHACGCSWDSGPFNTYCRDHDPDDKLMALLALLDMFLAELA